jgi:WD40 repeat protein
LAKHSRSLFIIADAKVNPPARHSQALDVVNYSPDGQYAVSGAGDGSPILWDISSGEIIYHLTEGHRQWTRVVDIEFSPDGQYMLSGSTDRSMILWDVSSGEVLRRFEGHTGYIFGVAFTPDGQTGLSASWDGTVRVWSLFDDALSE